MELGFGYGILIILQLLVWVMSITRVIVGQTCVLVMDLECKHMRMVMEWKFEFVVDSNHTVTY
jgi:hypothetical protein